MSKEEYNPTEYLHLTRHLVAGMETGPTGCALLAR
jgi:hypothetical protein